jgi:hypothetical protein
MARMIIALAQGEIADFLDDSRDHVAWLWRQTALKRSVFVDGRRNPELSHSTVFDVLEFYLRSDVMPDASGEVIDIWLSALDEFVEQEGWKARPFEDMVFALMEIVADFSGAVPDPEQLSRHAIMTLTAYFTLLRFLEPEHAELKNHHTF